METLTLVPVARDTSRVGLPGVFCGLGWDSSNPTSPRLCMFTCVHECTHL